MARPTKQGLDYFSLDVEMDDETEIIKAEHGMAGFGVLIAMFQSVYKDKGYYRTWDERNQILFSKRVSTDKKLVIDVINDCINWGIFNKKMYEKYQILTSNRIQRQYINATYRRAEVKLYSEYLLVDEEKLDRGNITCISVSDIKNHTGKQDNDEQQSTKYKDKDKESKVNKSTNNKRSDSGSSPNNDQEQLGEEGEVEEKDPESKFDKKSNAFKAACYLRDRIEQNNPKAVLPDKIPKDMEDWATELDRLNRLGPVGAKESEDKGYSWQEIREIIDWCQDHNFWKSNILSAGKLRKQIIKLENQMKRASPGTKQKQAAKDNQLRRLMAKAEG